MTRDELVLEIKTFCADKNLTFRSCIFLGNRDILVLIQGNNAANLLDDFLEHLALKYTKPCKVLDSIGSYVTI